METILDRILREKKKEIIRHRTSKPEIPLLKGQKRSFIQKLQKADEIAIIAEYKRASPSKGIINNGVEPGVQAKIYAKNGASAISVLTDEVFFKGSFSDLRQVRDAVELPILCKDFIIDPIQIDLAETHGADVILLIAAALDQSKLLELYQYAKSLDLEVLIEVHNREELAKALLTDAKLIGVNNRDLKSFHVSLDVTEQLATTVKNSGAFLISESGIQGKEDVERVKSVGANGILVGEALMKSKNLNQLLFDLRSPLR
ncbi:MAG TPA: indole-3-glycerol phosphate synthase TrpC [Neobacillus sp.]